ncbi:MAG: protein kinase, partial [Acidobacteriia bacterium]|nr:protein kinase [Terriglobia bacterium]
WREIEHYYLKLKDSSPEERQRYLTECDPQIRDAVERMLDQPSSDSRLFTLLSGVDVTATVSASLIGTSFGPYRIESLLGTGGMGAVYRGVDTRLDRPVAIKILKEQFNSRFEREARAISALNHPNICTLYDIGPNYLVMEFIEGDSLAKVLADGPLPREAAMRYAIQLSSALAAAHAKGIIHRDLKPHNIMLSRSAYAPEAKLLDFGIAKDVEPLHGEQFLTETGVRIGTPAYMAPEQLEGRPADPRTDIYALGLVLKEMFSDRRTGNRVPLDPALSAIIEKCLCHEPEGRWQSASELHVALTTAASPESLPRPEMTRRRALWLPLGVGAPVLAAGAWWWRRRAQERSAFEFAAPIHVAIVLPRNAAGADPGRLQGPPVVAPDGSAIAISLVTESGNAIYRRPLNSDELTRVDGTDGGLYPFWSPDSRDIAFFADDKLKRVPVAGGSVVTLSAAVEPRGGAWSSRGVIIFGLNGKGLFEIADRGGGVRALTELNLSVGENSHRYPVFLGGPDDRGVFFYFARADRIENRAIYVSSLDRRVKRRRVALADGQFTIARDRPGGGLFLLTQQSNKTMIQTLDANSLTVTGRPAVLLQHAGQVSASDSGVLAVRAQSEDQSHLLWRDRSGKEIGSMGEQGDYWEVALSQDERYAAAVVHNSLTGEFRVWVAKLPAGLLEPLTEENRVGEIAWMRREDVLLGFDTRRQQLLRVGVNPRGEHLAKQLGYTGIHMKGVDVAPDGKTLVGGLVSQGPVPILAWTTIDQGRWTRLGSSPIEGGQPTLSADGKWLAFESKATGRTEIDILDFPSARRRYRVSKDGGSLPKWRSDGGELYFISGNAMMAASISPSGEPSARPPEKRFEAVFRRGSLGRIYDVSGDGSKFLISEDANRGSQSNIELILNWPGLLARHA